VSDAPREWDAEAYHRLGHPQVAWGLRVLARLPLRGDERVLDAGCGSGRLTAHLLGRLPRGHVVGVDASAAMLARAREHLEPVAGGRLTLVHADLTRLRLPEPVDAVFPNAVLHHVTDHPAAFRALHGVLRPGGRLVAQCGGGPNLARIRAHVRDAADRDARLAPLRGWPGPWEFSDAPTAHARLVGAGFTEVLTAATPAPVRLTGPAAMRDHLRAITLRSHLARLTSEAARDALLDAVVSRAAADRSPFELDHWRLDLDARRP